MELYSLTAQHEKSYIGSMTELYFDKAKRDQRVLELSALDEVLSVSIKTVKTKDEYEPATAHQ